MKLELSASDLRSDFQRRGENGVSRACRTDEITFSKFMSSVQDAIRVVGSGMFYDKECTCGVLVRPPGRERKVTASHPVPLRFIPVPI